MWTINYIGLFTRLLVMGTNANEFLCFIPFGSIYYLQIFMHRLHYLGAYQYGIQMVQFSIDSKNDLGIQYFSQVHQLILLLWTTIWNYKLLSCSIKNIIDVQTSHFYYLNKNGHYWVTWLLCTTLSMPNKNINPDVHPLVIN